MIKKTYGCDDFTDLLLGLTRPRNGTVEASHVSEVANTTL